MQELYINNMSVYFEERQRYNQWWLWLMIGTVTVGTSILFLYGMVQQIYLGQTWGDRPMSDEALILTTLLTLGAQAAIVFLYFNLELQLRIDRHSLEYRFKPVLFNWRRIERETIRNYEVGKYFFMGSGIRIKLNGQRVYNIRGNKGIEITLTTGKKILIGTQQPDQLKLAMEKMMNLVQD